MPETVPTLICVYNADGDLVSTIVDFVHKIVAPATYPCSLCALTYGHFSMRREWRSFIENCGIPVRFLYRDEFRADLEPRNIALPVILLGWGAPQPEVLVSAAELSALSDVTELMALVQSRLAVQKP